jgi:hypothetical protein
MNELRHIFLISLPVGLGLGALFFGGPEESIA